LNNLYNLLFGVPYDETIGLNEDAHLEITEQNIHLAVNLAFCSLRFPSLATFSFNVFRKIRQWLLTNEDFDLVLSYKVCLGNIYAAIRLHSLFQLKQDQVDVIRQIQVDIYRRLQTLQEIHFELQKILALSFLFKSLICISEINLALKEYKSSVECLQLAQRLYQDSLRHIEGKAFVLKEVSESILCHTAEFSTVNSNINQISKEVEYSVQLSFSLWLRRLSLLQVSPNERDLHE
jgi:hypothetical protein